MLLCACLCVYNGLFYFFLLDNSAHIQPFMVPKACLPWKRVLFFCYDPLQGPCSGCFLCPRLHLAGSFLSFKPPLNVTTLEMSLLTCVPSPPAVLCCNFLPKTNHYLKLSCSFIQPVPSCLHPQCTLHHCIPNT